MGALKPAIMVGVGWTLLLASPTSAQSLGGITVGQSKDSALEALVQHGQVTRIPTKSEAYVGGEYNITICHGRVWGVTRDAGSSFATFTRMADVASAKYGKVSDTVIFNQEGPRYVGMVNLKWHLSGNLTYSVTAYGSGERVRASEAFTRTTFCR
jgi:hypothetical protein